MARCSLCMSTSLGGVVVWAGGGALQELENAPVSRSCGDVAGGEGRMHGEWADSAGEKTVYGEHGPILWETRGYAERTGRFSPRNPRTHGAWADFSSEKIV